MSDDVKWSSEDLAYLAGLIDAQGASVHVYIGTARKETNLSFKAYIHVQSSQKSLLVWIVNTFGGGFTIVHRKMTAARIKFDSCLPKGRMTKEQYKWTPLTKFMIPLGKQLLPYIKIRNEEIDCLIRAREQVENEDIVDWGKRKAIAEELKQIKLNKRSF